MTGTPVPGRDAVACITCDCGGREFQIEMLEDGDLVLGCADETCSSYIPFTADTIVLCRERLMMSDPALVS